MGVTVIVFKCVHMLQQSMCSHVATVHVFVGQKVQMFVCPKILVFMGLKILVFVGLVVLEFTDR